jgi:autotransporter-associated beta strand protein
MNLKLSTGGMGRWCAMLAAALQIGVAGGQVNVSANASSGTTLLQGGDSFSVQLAWSGGVPVGAADYAVTLGNSQLILTGVSFASDLGPMADTPYLPSLPVATNRVDVTWFREAGFSGSDLTLHFQVPVNYVGPATLAVGLAVDGAEDAAGDALAVTATGTSVNVFQSFTDSAGGDSGATARTVNWVSGSPLLSWDNGPPGVGGNPDRATVNLTTTSTSGDYNVDFNQDLTLNRLTLNMTGTANHRLGSGTRRTVTWVARGSEPAVLEFIRVNNNPLRNSFAADSVLESDLFVRLAQQGSKDGFFGGIVSGDGKLTVDYQHNVNNSTHATAGHIRIGTAGDAASTHTGGTRLVMSAGAVTTSNFRFWAAKTNAFGSGPLELNKVRLDLNAFNQTVGGLADGANGSFVTDISTSSTNGGVTTLTLDFPALAGERSYSGAINDGPARKLALVKSGSGTQILTGNHGYTGATTVAGGTLEIKGSLAAGSAVSVGATGVLRGSGVVNSPLTSHGTLAPGASVGTLNLEAVTLSAGSELEIEVADWAGNQPGTSWDFLNCASLGFQGSPANPVFIRVLPLELGGWAEEGKVMRIASSASAIAGFDPAAVRVDGSAMPGSGVWSARLDGTGHHLELMNEAGVAVPPTAFELWAEASGLPAGQRGWNDDADGDGASNLAEFAFGGDPSLPASRGLMHTALADHGGEDFLVLTLAVRRGAVFAAAGGQQVSQPRDGVVYRVRAGGDLAVWDGAVEVLGASDHAPAGSGLPDLTGSDWEYRGFRAVGGTEHPAGFLQAVVEVAP